MLFRNSAPMVSSPFQSDSRCPVAGSSAQIPLPPSTCSVNRICFADGHVSHAGDDLMPGVKLRAEPPVEGTQKMSPPMMLSSLISPPMKAIDLPSGDQHGSPICI